MRFSLVTIACLFGLYSAAVWGIPAYLASGTVATAASPDFASDEGWLLRPEARTDAVWENGWALDVIVVPTVPDVLTGHGLLATHNDTIRTATLAQQNSAIEHLKGDGAVYIPAIRMPSPSTKSPDWSTARGDLVAALNEYAKTDNRGRAVAFFADGNSLELLNDLPGLLEEAEAIDLIDRTVLVVTASEVDIASLSLTAFPNAQHHAMGLAQVPATANRWLALPLTATYYVDPAEDDAVGSALDGAVSASLQRATDNARKTVEPFGGFEIVREAPVNKPCEAGLRCHRD